MLVDKIAVNGEFIILTILSIKFRCSEQDFLLGSCLRSKCPKTLNNMNKFDGQIRPILLPATRYNFGSTYGDGGELTLPYHNIDYKVFIVIKFLLIN